MFDLTRGRSRSETSGEKFDVWMFECDVGLANEG